MPYFFEILETPLEGDPWPRLKEIWKIMHDDLMGVHFETEQEALDKAFVKSLDPNDLRLDSLYVARYRDTDDRENLRFFHSMALEALGETEVCIENKDLSPHFLNEWSKLLSGHGFVTAAIMARGPDVEGKRAGRAGGAATTVADQQKWFSHYYLRERPKYATREETEKAVWRLVDAITDEAIALPEGFASAWFDKFLNLEPGKKSKPNPHFGQLTRAFQQNRLSEKKMKRLVKEPTDGLPPLDLEVPNP